MALRKGKARRAHAPDAGSHSRASERAPSKRGPSKRNGAARSPLRRLIYWSLVLALWALIAVVGTIAFAVSTLPPIQTLEVPKRPPTIEIVGTDGRPLITRGEMSGTDISIKELPPYLPRAFVAIEDRRFFSHFGIDPIGLIRAAAANVLRRGVSQGGSTITQQLAKNLFLTQERTLWRKMQEVVLALWLERRFSKTEILELYLNRVYFGSGAYGVEAAAQRYFGKPAREVKVAEAAMLAGVVKSPSRLAPSRNPDGAERRARAVLAAMTELGFVTETMAKSALAQPAHAIKTAGTGSLNYVADWIMDVLDDLVGRVEQDLVVETSIDPTLQAAAEKALTDELALKGQKLDVAQGALVAITPEGAVRAMVGGRNYAESQFNRAVAAKRQPGSAFKPFVYLTALERGLTPETVREDKPVALKGWKPENYSREYHGPVTLTQALALSLNTVAVRLTLEVGPRAVAKTAYRLGIASKLDANPSLALGTSEVSLIELTCAYAPFANSGNATMPYVVARVRTRAGKILFTHAPQKLGRIIEPRHIAMMNAMMRETLVSGTAQRAQLPGWAAAGKTGTSQDFRDAWFVGYTGHLVTGVWLGNDDSSPTKKATGGALPVDIWSRFMKVAHQGVPVASLPGLTGAASFASALPNPLLSPGSSEAPVGQGGAESVRPQAINRSLDGWFLDRLFGQR
ncbi:MAG: penicillin-binding protein [Alphaproteobacteria bacterium]|nr:MAG: penicillin-binding protein [Alphaproteobacteria bacterium]TMJ98846.1 MAG: penicillin-binding protein [Alphaproteobacteria bacterium]